MKTEDLLHKVKKLREISGVGFKDCKIAIDECGGDVEKSIEFLRKKGISKATKRMQRVAAEGLISISQNKDKIAIIEINCETDFVAKNQEFINFSEQLSNLSLINDANIEKIISFKMKNNKSVNDNLIDLISKIGEKITIRRSSCIKNNNDFNFFYVHSSVKKNIGKLGVILSIEASSSNDDLNKLGHNLCMHIAASNPLAIDSNDLDSKLISKEEEIINEELKNNKKDKNIINKIAKGKLNKFIEENTLLNQYWIMEPKKKVKEIISEISNDNKIKIKSFIRYKVGEGL